MVVTVTTENVRQDMQCCCVEPRYLGDLSNSRVQRVAGSSTESEYYSLWAATREIMHTRRQMKECGFEQFDPTLVHEDNQAAKRISEDVVL